jgi:hypothetical protein
MLTNVRAETTSAAYLGNFEVERTGPEMTFVIAVWGTALPGVTWAA